MHCAWDNFWEFFFFHALTPMVEKAVSVQTVVGWHYVAHDVVARALMASVRLPATPAEWRASCPLDISDAIRKNLLIPRQTAIWPLLADGTYLYCHSLYRFDATATFHSEQKKLQLSKISFVSFLISFFFLFFFFFLPFPLFCSYWVELFCSNISFYYTLGSYVQYSQREVLSVYVWIRGGRWSRYYQEWLPRRRGASPSDCGCASTPGCCSCFTRWKILKTKEHSNLEKLKGRNRFNQDYFAILLISAE